MDKAGWMKTKHAGVFYWIKTVSDDDGKNHVCMIRCKVQE